MGLKGILIGSKDILNLASYKKLYREWKGVIWELL